MSSLSPLLATKLAAPTQSDQETKIELSEEDGETILDWLPMPNLKEPATLTATRSKIQNFLQTLRHF